MNCASCRYHSLEQMQGQIQRNIVCKWGPPSACVVTIPPGANGPGSPGGMTLQCLFPIMQPHQFCHRYEANAVASGDMIPSSGG